MQRLSISMNHKVPDLENAMFLENFLSLGVATSTTAATKEKLIPMLFDATKMYYVNKILRLWHI